MGGSKHWLALLLLTLVNAVLAAPGVAVAQGAFHVTFGTTASPDQRDADNAAFITETASGDLVVAGSGASYFSDDGQKYVNPLIARFSPAGAIRWQRVYRDLAQQNIIAFGSSADGEYALLEQSPAPRQQGPGFFLVKDIMLRRFDDRGDPSTVIAAVQGIRVTAAIPVGVGGQLESFLIVGSRGANDSEAAKATVEAFRLDVRGQITQLSVSSGLGNVVHLEYVGGDEFILAQHHQGVEHGAGGDGIHTDILRLRATGETQLLLTMTGLCYQLAASKQRIVCAVSPVLRSDQTNDAVVAYSATGQALWRHGLERGDTVDRMGLLESGDLIYSMHQRNRVTVTRLGPSGTPLWSETLRSTGEYTFLTSIVPLEHGRLAFLGSTGPWNGYTSTDTSAMLLVTATSADDLGAPSTVSTLMNRAAGR